jgi:hypothetical protein
VGNAVDVKMAFDFEAVGLSAPTAATDYILKLDGNQLDVTPTLEEGKIVFELSEVDEGVYSFGKAGAQPQVATPTFDPEGGEYNEAQEVTISTTTEGADIYYTTDGTDPDSTSTEYTDAVTVDEDMTLKAIAYKEGMTTSEIASADYTIVTGLNDPMAGNFISIYPNPVRNEAVIAMDNEELQGRFNLKVYNYVGNVVIDKQLNKHSSSYNYRLDMSELPAGIYLIEVSNDDIRSVRRIMKQ